MNNLRRSPSTPGPQDAASESGNPALTGEATRPVPSSHTRHAILDARAGLPIVLNGRDGVSVLVLPAETLSYDSLAQFLARAATQPQLVLAASRADHVMARPLSERRHGAAAFLIPPGQLTPATIRSFADPTVSASSPGPLDLVPAHRLAANALALAKLARLLPAMLVAEVRSGDGLISVSAEEILAHEAQAVTTLARVAEAAVPLAEAEDARLVAYRPADGGPEHVALLIGHPEDTGDKAPMVRIHSECFTGDLLGSLRCDCGQQLHQAIRRMEAEGSGVLLYMAQEGRGIGLVNKLRAYALQDRGLDTLDANRALGWNADERDFTAAAVMLHDLGITRVRLLTNNPEKVAALEEAGIVVTGRLRLAIEANGVNDSYLETKARRFGHLLG